MDVFYQKLVKHYEEVMELPPQTVGPLTPVYKAITKRLKVMPWFVLVGVSFFIVVVLYLLFGSTLTFLVSILQRGF
jgi:hypothetical protein